MIGGPKITHAHDKPEHEVVRINYRDGRVASVRERFLEMTPRYFSFHNTWEPGALAPRHGHHGDHVVYVLDGEITVGDEVCTKGSHIFLQYGDTFGPWVAGPNGAELLGIIFNGDGRAFFEDADMVHFQQILDERGAEMGTVPALTCLPAWRSDQHSNPLPGPVANEQNDKSSL